MLHNLTLIFHNTALRIAKILHSVRFLFFWTELKALEMKFISNFWKVALYSEVIGTLNAKMPCTLNSTP